MFKVHVQYSLDMSRITGSWVTVCFIMQSPSQFSDWLWAEWSGFDSN